MSRLATIALLGAGACASGTMEDPDAAVQRPDSRQPDAPPETPDAPPDPSDAQPGTPDAPPSPDPTHLLLSEIVLTPTQGELIEIANPTGLTVDLSIYYLTDAPTYFQLPAGTQTVDSTDFIARFPAGALLEPGGVITVAVDTAANFQLTYGAAPNYAITGGTMTVVPATGTRTLTNSGEPVVLFRWDGASDRVTDVDIVIAGAPTAVNMLAVKSGFSLDGPDADATPTAYATDANTLPNTAAPGGTKSLKRILLEGNYESHSGGNGIGGDDETTEQVGSTWDSVYTAPTPGSSLLMLPL